MQDNKPLAFYSRKMDKAQQRYTTGEQELLSIVETLKEFRNILFGQKIIVHTDHKNIIYGNLSNDRIIRWRLLLEEFSPAYVHVAGKDNVVADALSRMEADFPNPYGDFDQDTQAQLFACAMVEVDKSESYALPETPTEIAETFITNKDLSEERYPLSPKLIAKEQRKDKTLQKAYDSNKAQFKLRQIEGIDLITFDNKIVLPKSLQGRVIAWYHKYLVHPGQTRMEETLRQTLTWPKMREDIRAFVRTCPKCQLCKRQCKKYGKLPLKQAEPPKPWNRVNVDMIGPLTVKTPNGTKELLALTMIDPATGWFEVKDVTNATAEACMEAFDDTWLSRYPRPQFIGYDGGSEYKNVFDEMRANYGMTRRVSTSYNPQSNGIIERVHQVLNDALRTFELSEHELDEHDPWASFLSATAYAIRSTYHTTLEASPCQLVFGRDMMLPIRFKANWASIQQKRQAEMKRNNDRENRSRIDHEYKVGDKVLLTKPGIIPKLEKPRKGPYNLVRVYTNGTVRIQRGAITERVNIRRISPYFES